MKKWAKQSAEEYIKKAREKGRKENEWNKEGQEENIIIGKRK